MFEVIILLIGSLPFLVGLYALHMLRSDDHTDRDEPPPPDPLPPQPQAPLPPVPRRRFAPRRAPGRTSLASRHRVPRPSRPVIRRR
ncbi:MAG: hypothetical protein AAGI71_17385 [Bacteroidota bacterium]